MPEWPFLRSQLTARHDTTNYNEILSLERRDANNGRLVNLVIETKSIAEKFLTYISMPFGRWWRIWYARTVCRFHNVNFSLVLFCFSFVCP